MKKFLTLILIFTLLCTAVYATQIINVPNFKIAFQSISDGQSNVTITPRILFDFNLRIDPTGISATINGEEKYIKEILIHEGKKLEIVLNEPLEYESEYTLRVFGVKEIYSSQPSPLGEIKFKTISHVELVSENVDNSARSYCAQVKNYSANSKDIIFIVTARDNVNNMVLDVKVLKKSVKSGETADFPYTFSNLNKQCKIFAVGFSDFNTLTPLINPKQSAGE